MLSLHLGRDTIIGLITEDSEVAAIMRAAWSLFLLCNFIETIQLIGMSVMNATLKQRTSIVLNFIAFFMIGLPLACVFAFMFDMAVGGIWLGYAHAQLFLAVCFNMIIARIDWMRLVKKVRDRAI